MHLKMMKMENFMLYGFFLYIEKTVSTLKEIIE